MKVNPGKGCPTSYTVDEIAQANVDVLRRCMPVAIRSANFLSGGQSLEDAAARLCAMNKVKGNFPVNLSFSWSAALQVRDLIPFPQSSRSSHVSLLHGSYACSTLHSSCENTFLAHTHTSSITYTDSTLSLVADALV